MDTNVANGEEFLSAAKISKEVDQRIYRTIRYAPFLAKLIYVIGAAVGALIIRVVFWISSIDSRFETFSAKYSEFEKHQAATEGKIEGLQNTLNAYVLSNDKVITSQTNLLAGIQKELDDRKPLTDQVRELWFMKDHGISNKEDFLQKHGYQAPSNEQEIPIPRRP